MRFSKHAILQVFSVLNDQLISLQGVAVVAGVVWKALTMKKAPDYDVEKYFWDPKTGCVVIANPRLAVT